MPPRSYKPPGKEPKSKPNAKIGEPYEEPNHFATQEIPRRLTQAQLDSLARGRAKSVVARFRPGQSGNPSGVRKGWSRRLQDMLGDGEELWKTLIELAKGNTVFGEEVDPITGEITFVPIRPNPYTVLTAINMLADRAWGRPKQTHRLGSEDSKEDQAAPNVQQTLELLSEEQKAQLRAIGQTLAKLGGNPPPRITSGSATPAVEQEEDAPDG